jgi:HCOMODA/2-hydroxy-3-carboxy-muconic semialdehyde decarboxylase
MVLMKRHGVTVAGISLQDCVFRTIFSARNAEYQVQAMMLGDIEFLSPGETEMSSQISKKTHGLMRSWEYWSTRVAKAGGALKPARAAASKAKPKARSSAKRKARRR